MNDTLDLILTVRRMQIIKKHLFNIHKCTFSFGLDLRSSNHKRILTSRGSREDSRPPTSPGRSRQVVCYVCGNEFSTLDIAKHEPQCLQKQKVKNQSSGLKRTPGTMLLYL